MENHFLDTKPALPIKNLRLGISYHKELTYADMLQIELVIKTFVSTVNQYISKARHSCLQRYKPTCTEWHITWYELNRVVQTAIWGPIY